MSGDSALDASGRTHRPTLRVARPSRRPAGLTESSVTAGLTAAGLTAAGLTAAGLTESSAGTPA